MITEANYAEEALLAMKSRPPNIDGTIGFTVHPAMPEWRAWQAYFYGKHMDVRASFMRTRREQGYMVPCRNPGDFDGDIAQVRRTYAQRVKRGEVPEEVAEKTSSQMTPAEREVVLAKAKVGVTFKPKLAGRYAQEDVRVEDRPMPTTRDLTEAERASMARMLGEPYREAAE